MRKRLKKKLDKKYNNRTNETSISNKSIVNISENITNTKTYADQVSNDSTHYKVLLRNKKQEKLIMVERLLKSYVKEEYLLLDILKYKKENELISDELLFLKSYKSKQDEVIKQNTEYRKDIVKLKKEKILILNRLFQSYCKEENMFYSYRTLLKKKQNEEDKNKQLVCDIEEYKKIIFNLEKQVDDLEKQVDDLEKQVDDLKKYSYNLEGDFNNSKAIIKNNKHEILQYKNIIKNKDSFINEYRKQIINLKMEKLNVAQRLLNSYMKEELLLKSYNELDKQNSITNKKYNSLKESKLGKFTLWYWKKRKGIIG